MPLTNAEKQKRWRDKRNLLADALTGTPKDIADGILRELGVEQAKKVTRALDKRFRNLKPDCPQCGGTGFSVLSFSGSRDEVIRTRQGILTACHCSATSATEVATNCAGEDPQTVFTYAAGKR
jgi:hypothetical protein